MKQYKVYIHKFPNGKVYIGITGVNPRKRWQYGKGYKHNKYLTDAFIKYGWENIEHIILYDNLTKEEAEQKEIELIKKYKSNNNKYGYNIENGGNSIGKLSNETKIKLSIAHKGKKIREETKKKISEANKKIIISEEHKKILSKRMKENNPSKRKEVREKIKKAHLGKKLTEEHKEKIRQSMLKRRNNNGK